MNSAEYGTVNFNYYLQVRNSEDEVIFYDLLESNSIFDSEIVKIEWLDPSLLYVLIRGDAEYFSVTFLDITTMYKINIQSENELPEWAATLIE